MTAWSDSARVDKDSLRYWSTLEDDFIEADVYFKSEPTVDELPQLGDIYSGEDTPDAMRVVRVGPYEKKTGRKMGHFMATVRFAAPKISYESGLDGLYEVNRLLRTGRRGRVYGTRVFLAADSDAETLAASYLGEFTPMFDSGPWSEALLRELEIERRWRVGVARLTAVYDNHAENARLEQVGKGLLETDAEPTWMWFNEEFEELGNRRLGEEWQESGDWYKWVLSSGAQVWPYVQTQARIRVLVNQGQLDQLAGLVGKVNSQACPHIFSNADALTLWFNGLRTRQRDDGSGRSDALIFLLFEPSGWDTVNKAIKLKHVVQRIRNEEVPEEKRLVEAWKPTGDSVELAGWVNEDFSLIDGFLA